MLDKLRTRRRVAQINSIFVIFIVALGSLLFSQVLITRLGFSFFAFALGVIFVGAVYAIISVRNILVPFVVYIVSIGGLRYLWSIQTPVLPDLYLDRMTFLWLLVVFMVKVVVEKRQLIGPWKIETLLLIHAIYLLVSIMSNEMEDFHKWTMSTLIPYFSFFFAKNILNNNKAIRGFLVAMLALLIFYDIVAVSEKLHFDALVCPKIILSTKNEFAGRSIGPFLHAPVFGTVIGMLLPIHLYFIAQSRSRLVKLLLYMSFVIGIAALYFTYTRGSWLVGLVSIAVVSFLNRKQYLRIILPAVVVIPFVAFSFLGLAQDKFMKKRLENEGTVGYRLATAVMVARMWEDHPLLGVGYFQYKNYKEHYTDPVEIPILGNIDSNTLRHSVIHDIYFGPLAEEGLLGAGLQVAIYFLIFKAYWRRFRQKDLNEYFQIMVIPLLLGLTVGYLVGGLAIDYRYFSFLGTLFFVSAGIVDGYVAESKRSVV